ncbi:MAG: hypothetical protein ACE5D0_06560 [Fidelibacterota bacterium]
MILNVVLSIFSLYPWNIGASSFYTAGEYSNGSQSISKTVFWSMDERKKNGFVLGYEELIISSDNGDYEQYNLLTKDMFWIKKQLRLGGLAGRMTSNNTDNGWFLGGLVEGDFKWFGYSFGLIQSNFQQWHLFSNQLAEWDNVNIKQYSGVISRRIRSITIFAGAQYQEFQEETYITNSISLSGFFYGKFGLTVSGSFGESRYSFDPYLLILNNNPEILKKNLSAKLLYRINPNWYIHGAFALHEYEYEQSINYSSIGIQCRF